MSEFHDHEDGNGNEDELVQLVGMKLGEEEYAIDVLKIQEIIRTVEITIVPRMESFILGVMNLRGKVIPVIDLRVRFNLENYDFSQSTRIIVVTFDKQFIGFVVDEVTEVMRIRKSMVEPTPPLVGSISQEYILGICKYDARLVMLLDIDRVLSEGGDQIESELRKKMIGSKHKPAPANSYVPPSEPAPAPASESDSIPDTPDEELPKPDEVPSPVISAAEEEPAVEQEDSDATSIEEDEEEKADLGGNIDDLIAKELAMREAETEELNKKKRESGSQNNDEILADALAQSNAIFKTEKSEEHHVDQDDLDSLIAKELAKREAETDELNRRHREEKENSEKKNDIDSEVPSVEINLDIPEPDKVETPMFDIVQEPISAPEPSLEISGTASPSENISVDANEPVASSELVQEELSPSEGGDSEPVHVSMKELKRIADKIISGEHTEELDGEIKGEIGELLRLIIDTKSKVDEIAPAVQKSQETMPTVTDYLEDVNKTTEKAAFNLLDASNGMAEFYRDFIGGVNELKSLANAEHEKEFNELYEKVCGRLTQAEDLGFKILEALEFQDITEQKLGKVIKSIEEMGARLGAIIGFLQVKQPKTDAQAEKLLEDYGLA